jgi:thioredoxin 1
MTVREVNDATLKSAIPSHGAALVDFGAAWCPPCKALLPVLHDLDRELGGAVTILKVDADDCPEAVSEFGIRSMPTVIVFKNGVPVDKFVGLRPKEAYKAALAR